MRSIVGSYRANLKLGRRAELSSLLIHSSRHIPVPQNRSFQHLQGGQVAFPGSGVRLQVGFSCCIGTEAVIWEL